MEESHGIRASGNISMNSNIDHFHFECPAHKTCVGINIEDMNHSWVNPVTPFSFYPPNKEHNIQ